MIKSVSKLIYQSIGYGIQRKFNLKIKPKYINFISTYKCNARCIMCNIWNKYNTDNKSQLKEELTVKDIDKFTRDNSDFLDEVTHIGLTGGDSLLMRDDIVEVVRVLRKNLPKARIGSQTNGLIVSLAKKRLDEIISFYPEFSLAVSIDGIGETHSKMRGIPEAFEKAVETIKYAQSLGIKDITCGMTLTPINYQEIKEVKNYVESLDCEFSCFLTEESDYFNNKDVKKSDSAFTAEQIHEIKKMLKENTTYHYFMDNLRLQLEGKRKREVPCYSGFTSLTIDPFGNVKPCILQVAGLENDIFVNIKDTRFKEMLFNEKALKIKEMIKKCSCWCQCEVSTSVMASPWDVGWWFLFYCEDKKGFINKSLKKII